jgi:hypothetical protein
MIIFITLKDTVQKEMLHLKGSRLRKFLCGRPCLGGMARQKELRCLEPAYFSPGCSSFRHHFQSSTKRKTDVTNKLSLT